MHRDVSPSNVMVSRLGEVRVVDFGVARSTVQSVRTSTGAIKGKVAYMSHAARVVIAEVNDAMPRTLGNSAVPFSRVHAHIRTSRPLHEAERPTPSAEERAIGETVAGLVDDGACLQMGIGAIPDAVLSGLGNKHDLGVHTEVFSDGLIPLLRGGVVTSRKKKVHAGRTVT